MIFDDDKRPEEDYDDELWDKEDDGIFITDDEDSGTDDQDEDRPDERDVPTSFGQAREQAAGDGGAGDETGAPAEEEDDYYSDPAPRGDEGKKRSGLFGLGRHGDDEDGDNDFYTSDAEPPKPPKQPKPTLDPEDPDYWIEEESDIASIINTGRTAWKWWLSAAAVVLLLIAGCWVWFMRPYVDDAVKYGYIKTMERRGSLVKTFEGVLIPYRELGDPTPMYFEEIPFSVESDSLAACMKRMMLGCVPVRVEYKCYRKPLPWKGDARMIVVKADTADVTKILPPEYQWRHD
ncbi:MAG: hypothetical protein K2K93_05395 [Muribaculaceae bacterium]|nr:hypothetical protein [Muribaculaceae bacterium]